MTICRNVMGMNPAEAIYTSTYTDKNGNPVAVKNIPAGTRLMWAQAYANENHLALKITEDPPVFTNGIVYSQVLVEFMLNGTATITGVGVSASAFVPGNTEPGIIGTTATFAKVRALKNCGFILPEELGQPSEEDPANSDRLSAQASDAIDAEDDDLPFVGMENAGNTAGTDNTGSDAAYTEQSLEDIFVNDQPAVPVKSRRGRKPKSETIDAAKAYVIPPEASLGARFTGKTMAEVLDSGGVNQLEWLSGIADGGNAERQKVIHYATLLVKEYT